MKHKYVEGTLDLNFTKNDELQDRRTGGRFLGSASYTQSFVEHL
jgi:hypothetical protein